MKRFSLIMALTMISGMYILAQKEQNNWLFGFNAGLTWQPPLRTVNAIGMYGTPNATLTNMPSIIPKPPISTYEGCFSLSDANGDLLMFSDGITIWNKQLQPMPHANPENGTQLTGHPSSAQSGIILPHPQDANKYIVVTVGYCNANNLAYSIVDMKLQNGLGDVVAGQRNIKLTGAYGTLGETVTAVRHANKRDFWIIALGRGTSTYLNVWQVTNNGVNTSLHSHLLIPGKTWPDWANGCIKFSPDGKSYAFVNFGEGRLNVGTFDNITGKLLSIKQRSLPPSSYGYPYGVEFSKSGKYLYVVNSPLTIGDNQGSVLQAFDLSKLLGASNLETVSPLKRINNTRSYTPNGGHFGSIAMGPDGYMYINNFETSSTFVITNPEDPANLKIYNLPNFLGSGKCYWGLPSFTASWFRVEIACPRNICIDKEQNYDIRVFNGEGFQQLYKVTVDFGDGEIKTITSPVVGSNIVKYAYKSPGTYTISLKVYDASDKIMPEMNSHISAKVTSCTLPINPNIHISNNN